MAGTRVGGGLTGAKEAQRELKRIAKAAPGALARGLYQMGVEVQAEAVRRAPVETGILRTSGYVAPPEQEDGEPSVEVGFGTVYAAVQHEGVDFEHPRGGEAKYLENAVKAKASLERLATFTRSNFEKGLGVEALPKLAPTRPSTTKRAERRKARRAKRRAALKAQRKQQDLKRQQKRRKTRGRKRRKK